MQCSQLNLSESLIESFSIKNGKLSIFHNYCVLEIDEGTIVNFENSKDLLKHINHYYKDGRPFGIISNRTDSYSIDLSETHKFRTNKIQPVAKAVVTYNETSKRFIALENHFCKIKRQGFPSLEKAEEWILNEVEVAKKQIIAIKS